MTCRIGNSPDPNLNEFTLGVSGTATLTESGTLNPGTGTGNGVTGGRGNFNFVAFPDQLNGANCLYGFTQRNGLICGSCKYTSSSGDISVPAEFLPLGAGLGDLTPCSASITP